MKYKRFRKFRKYKYGNRWYDHTFESYKDSCMNFVKSEFYNLDKGTLDELALSYKNEHGLKAYNYLNETYYKWKRGTVRISDQTINRLLKYVPKLLSKKKQYELLKLEIISFMENFLEKHRNNVKQLCEIDEIYEDYLKAVKQFNGQNLRWFVNGAFASDELDEFISISKYVMQKKIHLSLKQVQYDLELIRNLPNSFEGLYYEMFYTIDLLGIKIEVKGDEVFIPNFDFKIEARNISENKEHLKEIVLDEILKITFIENKSQLDGSIQEQDLNIIIKNINNLKFGKKEFHISSSLQGRGGLLNMNIEAVNAYKFLLGLSLNIIIIIINIILLIFFLYLHLSYKIPSKSKCYIFLGWAIVLWISGYNIILQSKKVKENLINYKKYGR
jgi:hypothetical protein